MIVERGTNQGAVDAKDTTEGVQTIEGVSSRKQNPPAC